MLVDAGSGLFQICSMPAVAPPPPPVLPDQLALIIEGLRRVVAERAVERYRAGDRAATLLLNLVYARLGRLFQRFALLVAAFKAGRLPAAPASRRRADPDSRSSPGSSRGASSRASPEKLRLPGGFGWLLRLVPGHWTTGYGAQLQHWLADPEVVALLKEAPQAGRILRPLLRMLRIELPPVLRLPRRERRAAPPASPAVPDALPPDAAPASPRAPSPGARSDHWRASPELARLSDEELARRLADARAGPPLIRSRGRPRPD